MDVLDRLQYYLKLSSSSLHALFELKKSNMEKYHDSMMEIVTILNSPDTVSFRPSKIVDFMEDSSCMVYFERRNESSAKGFDENSKANERIPLDAHFSLMLNDNKLSQLIVVMKAAKRYLNHICKSILYELDNYNTYTRYLSFKNLSISAKVNNCINDLDYCQTLSEFVEDQCDKLDLADRLDRIVQQLSFELSAITKVLKDDKHVKHGQALDWLETLYLGDLSVFLQEKAHAINNLENRIHKIKKDLNMPVASNTSWFVKKADVIIIKDRSPSWFSVGSDSIQEGSLYTTIDEKRRITDKIRNVSVAQVKKHYDVGQFKDIFETLKHERNPNARMLRAVQLYYLLETRLQESANLDGEVHLAIKSNFIRENISQEEYEQEIEWAKNNGEQLKNTQVELFQYIQDAKKELPNLYVPKGIEARLGEQDKLKRSKLERVDIDAFSRQLKELEKSTRNDPKQLNRLLLLQESLLKARRQLSDVVYLTHARQASPDFESFEEKLKEFSMEEEQLEELREACEKKVISVYRNVDHENLTPANIKRTIELITDHMLRDIRMLNFKSISYEKFEGIFYQIIQSKQDNAAVYSLDTLMREIQMVPMQEQLKEALKTWGLKLPPEEKQELLNTIISNSSKLRELKLDIAGKLRSALDRGKTTDITLTNRALLHVFGLSKHYAEDLRELLNGLNRSLDDISTVKECNYLVRNIQIVEDNALDAYTSSSEGGEFIHRIKELEKSRNLNSDLLQNLKTALNTNKERLNEIVKDAQESLCNIENHVKRLAQLENGHGESGHSTNEDGYDYLSVKVSLSDLVHIKKNFNFMGSVDIPSLKRFARLFNLRTRLLEEVFEQANSEKKGQLPKELASLIRKKDIRKFFNNLIITDFIKVEILYNYPNILEAECKMISYFLNFISNDSIKETNSYKFLLTMIRKLQAKDDPLRNKVHTILKEIVRGLFEYKPIILQELYKENQEALLQDLNQKLPQEEAAVG